MKTNRKKPKYKTINGELYEAITSNYDGRVIGWGKVYENKQSKLTNHETNRKKT